MRVRVSPAALATFISMILVLDSMRDLAGPASRIVADLPLLLALFSLLHLGATWFAFGFHQDFSTDHPAKGDVVTYRVVVRNGLPFPAAAGFCSFHSSSPLARSFVPLPLSLGGGRSLERTTEIACAYRGVYAFGAASFSFADAFGILRIEHRIEPHVFYVYPELARIGGVLETLAEGGGEQSVGSASADPAVFESLAPLVGGGGGARIAWKRWASTGIPCVFESGHSAAFGLRVVLDLRPCGAEGEERLAAEDLAVTACYSLLERLSRVGIPAEFVLGGEERGLEIGDEEAFRRAYDASTNVLFDDPRFPSAAFSGGRASILVSTVAIAETRDGKDLFGALEEALSRSFPVRLIASPPPSAAESEKERALAAAERLGRDDRFPVVLALDTRRGAEDLVHAFSD